ncbi:hypothetical protein [uncultured Treponema sp.]|uniref:hypothetical protein n=1 Tax=uncultured Treponema sp. TaxID=162155 RepID=UPI0025EF3D35|nr:hypothetical protein [uncultured Treponema sp.]
MKKKILAVFYSVCLLLSLFAERVIRSRKQISDRTNDKIIRTLREAQSCIYDYNDDGLINCIDYACLFKLTWDKKFPAEKSRCSLIRNSIIMAKPNTGFHKDIYDKSSSFKN